MSTKTSSASSMSATDRRTFVQKAAAALGVMPLAGCTNDFDGLKVGNDTDNETGNDTDTPTPLEPPFDHAVTLNLHEFLRPDQLKSLTVQFIATFANDPPRKSPEHFFNASQLAALIPMLPQPVTDNGVIDLSEAGTVSCTCTFEYQEPNPADPPVQTVEDASHLKAADVDLQQFELTVANQAYVLA